MTLAYNDPKGQAIVVAFIMPSNSDTSRIELLQRLKTVAILSLN